jgi:hypothetical protein
MQHLTEEQLVEHYYHDDAPPAAAEQHIRECAECSRQYAALREVLTLVSNAEVPERGETYGTEVWNRLRWKLGRDRRRHGWQTFVAAAAVLVMAFLAGRYLPRDAAKAPGDIARGNPTAGPAVATQNPASRQDRMLFLVVSDHLDSSERMLLEVANADVEHGIAHGTRERAQELVAESRIYRQTAARRGDARIASVLSDIEPILVELSNAGTTLSSEDLARLQKRIESRGLLFKVRVISAQVEEGEQPPARSVNRSTSNSM